MKPAPSIMTAFLLFDSTVFEVDSPVFEPFRVSIRRADGSIVDSGRPFRTYERACAFVEGLDVAARLFGARVLLDETSATATECSAIAWENVFRALDAVAEVAS